MNLKQQWLSAHSHVWDQKMYSKLGRLQTGNVFVMNVKISDFFNEL